MNLDKRITLQIPHNMRMALGILADSMGITIAEYVRGIMENYAAGIDVKGPIPSYMGKFPSADVWRRVAYAMHEAGEPAHISFRMTDAVFAAINEGTVYNRSTLIRSLIISHIYRNVPRLEWDHVKDLSENIRKVSEKCQRQLENIANRPPN